MKSKNIFLLLILFTGILFIFIACTSTGSSKDGSDKEDTSSMTLEEQTYKGVSVYVATGDPDQAINAFERAKEEAPDDPDTIVLYAALLMSAGMIEDAEAELNSVLSEYPDHTNAMYNMALIRDIQGRVDERNELLEKILSIDPGHAKANATMGEVYMANKKPKKAEKAFALSLEKEPDNLVAKIGYGNALRQNEKYEESLKALNEAVELSPDYSFAYLDRAKTKLRLRDTAGAEEDLGVAIERDPDYYWHYIDRGKVRLIELGNLKAALEDFNHAIQLRPDYFYAYVYRGAIYLDMWESEKAAADLLFVYECEPKYRRIYNQLASALFISGDFNSAASFFALSAKSSRDDYSPKMLQILSLLKAGKEDEAKSMALEYYPKIPREHVLYHVARAYAEKGYEAIAFRNMEEKEDVINKIQASFFMAELYDYDGKTNLAQKLYIEVSDNNILELEETRIAKWELKRFGIE